MPAAYTPLEKKCGYSSGSVGVGRYHLTHPDRTQSQESVPWPSPRHQPDPSP
jgi:hypothetical protein